MLNFPYRLSILLNSLIAFKTLLLVTYAKCYFILVSVGSVLGGTFNLVREHNKHCIYQHWINQQIPGSGGDLADLCDEGYSFTTDLPEDTAAPHQCFRCH